ncbi:MAG: DUF4124 domain-containing protein [Candidatus Sedimenticola sp. (ex Thyasira tokunagai)]
MLTRTLLTACIITLFQPTAAVAKNYYHWVDKEGNQVYSETPPEAGVDAETRRLAPSAPPQKLPEPKKSQYSDGKKSAYEKKKQAEVEEMVQKNCDAARHNLSLFQDQKTTLIKNPDGSYDKVTDEMRKVQGQKAEEQIKEFCKEPGK